MIYKIEVSDEDLVLMGAGIDLLPHGKVASLVKRVQEQIDVQKAEVEKQAEMVL